jgi:hypothetical protein
MASILRTDSLQNLNTSNIITQTNATTLTIGASGQTISLASGASSSGFGATYNSGLNWTSTLVTSALTVSAGIGYFVNTSTAAITLTLPSTPTFGNIVGIVDYSGYASTNNIIINPNGNKLEGGTAYTKLTTNRESVILNYVDSTQGWVATSGVNSGTQALEPVILDVDFLVIAGGAGGGAARSASSHASGGGGGAGGYRTSVGTSGGGGSAESTLSISIATNYSLTVGAGGAGGVPGVDSGTSGVNSIFSTITSTGGGGGSGYPVNGVSGGSGGGAGGAGGTPTVGGSGTANQGYAGGNGASGPQYGAGGGGGAGSVGVNGTTSVGGNGGSGVSSNITGSSVTRAGGGGGGVYTSGGTPGFGGSGGGGNAGQTFPSNGVAATANTGSGGGGGTDNNNDDAVFGGNGGSGIVILKYIDSFTISNPGGGLTFTTATAGGFSVTTFTAGTGNIQWI